jgi:hypothetical protein
MIPFGAASHATVFHAVLPITAQLFSIIELKHAQCLHTGAIFLQFLEWTIIGF